MRAREFTINIPINIKINGDGEPEISADQDVGTFSSPLQQKLDLLKQAAVQSQDKDDGEPGTFVPPLQQKLELMKHAAGKNSPVIDQIKADDDNEAS